MENVYSNEDYFDDDMWEEVMSDFFPNAKSDDEIASELEDWMND